MDYIARAKGAAAARWGRLPRKTEGKIDVGDEQEKIEAMVAATKAVEAVPAKLAKVLASERLPGQPCQKHGRTFCKVCWG